MVDAESQASAWRQHVVLGVRVHDLSEEELRQVLGSWLAGDTARIVVTPNPEFVMHAQRDVEFRNLLCKADLSLPDGVGLRFAVAALTQDRLEHRHTGADTLVSRCGESTHRLRSVNGYVEPVRSTPSHWFSFMVCFYPYGKRLYFNKQALDKDHCSLYARRGLCFAIW
jgi:hypothetical protein